MTTTEVNRWVSSRMRKAHKTCVASFAAVLWGVLGTARLGIAAVGRMLSGRAKARHRIPPTM